MYATRFDAAPRFRPASLATAVGINAAIIAALVFANPGIIPSDGPVLVGYPVPLPPVPPKATPEAPQPPRHPRAAPDPRPGPDIHKTGPTVIPPFAGDGGAIDGDSGTESRGADEGTGSGPVEPSRPPVLHPATLDPRFMNEFQPDYPAAERRANREGRVVVRVLVGANGRVSRVEQVSTTSDAFFAATERRALSRWRFRPATSDGGAVEAWQTITVTFRLTEEE